MAIDHDTASPFSVDFVLAMFAVPPGYLETRPDEWHRQAPISIRYSGMVRTFNRPGIKDKVVAGGGKHPRSMRHVRR